MKLKKKKYWIAGLVLILVCVGVYKKFTNSDGEKDEKDLYIQPSVRTIENKQILSGKLVSSKEVNLKSELGGVIEAIYVSVGDEVKKGQAIAKLRTLPDPKMSQEAERQISVAHTNLERVRANYERNKTLYEKDVIAKQDLEVSVQEYKLAEIDLRNANENKKIVTQGFSRKNGFVSDVVYSTTDGIVLDIPVKTGATIMNRNNFNEGTTIATIADMNQILFKGQINERDLSKLDLGKKMLIRVNALRNQNFESEVVKISPIGVDVGGITRFDIEAKLLVSAVDLYKFKSGFTASAEFVVDRVSNALSVEEKYIRYKEDTSYVYIKSGESKKRIILETGISDGQYIEIIKGLRKNDKVMKEEMENEK